MQNATPHPRYPTFAQRLLRIAARLPIPKLRGAYAMLPPFLDDSPRNFIVDFYGLEYNGTLAQYVDRQIFYFGAYSRVELCFLSFAASILHQNGRTVTFVDVGANVGQHSLFMSRHADRVVAFEPNNEVADRFEANVKSNHLKNIELVRSALGCAEGIGRLGSGFDNNSGARSLVWSIDQSKDTVVVIANADAEFERRGVKVVNLVKIDVEGYEKNVFEGMRNTLVRDRPVLLFELVGDGAKGGFTSEEELRGSLYSNAELFSLVGKSNPRLREFDWQREEAVCLPKELVEYFRQIID